MVRLTVVSARVKRMHLGRICSLFVAVVVLLALIGVQPADAAGSYVVDTDSDANLTACTAAPNDCSLRGAINAANAVAGADTITFAADYTITLDGSSLPDVTTELTISGNGAANTIVQASICNPVTLLGSCTPATYRVFNVTSAGNLTLDGLTVQHGATRGMAAASITTAG